MRKAHMAPIVAPTNTAAVPGGQNQLWATATEGRKKEWESAMRHREGRGKENRYTKKNAQSDTNSSSKYETGTQG